MLGEFAALGAAVSWAVAPMLYRKALSNTKPLSANIVRCVTNAAVLLFFMLILGNVGALAGLPIVAVVVTVVSGVVGLGIGDTFYMIALKSVGVTRAVPLAATYPLFSLVWATFLLGEPLTLTTVLGACVILFGIWLLSQEKNEGNAEVEGKVPFTGVIMSLATAVVWSVSVTLMGVAVTLSSANSLDGNYSVITLRMVSMAVFLMILAPFLDRERGFLKMKRKTVLELCIGGLVANGVGWLLMNYSFLNTLETRAVPISSTTPLFTAVAGFLFFHEKVTSETVLGAVVIVFGIFLIFLF
ncbi:MAG: DMT family transporter [Candidatus Bathyarchaeota archaeon]|nr:DMT family transporter [Candidatus Bathyarchaeota archaeon]